MNTNVHVINDLLSGITVGRYDYLKVVLSKNCDNTIGQEYLMVTRYSFEVVKLLAVKYLEDTIRMDFQFTRSGLVRQVHLDVEDSRFKFLLVCWDDIRKMMLEENCQDDGLLEFDF